MTRSERASARRVVLRHLTTIRRNVQIWQKWWDVTGQTVCSPAERDEWLAGGAGSYLRDRRPEEYPEAQRRYWASTVAGIDVMINDLQALREHCVNEYHKTPEGE